MLYKINTLITFVNMITLGIYTWLIHKLKDHNQIQIYKQKAV